MSAGDRIRKATQQPETPAFRKPSGRASYPRRVTLDLDDARYEFMQWAAYEHRTSIAELLRAVVDELRADEKLLGRVAKAVSTPPPRR